MESISGILYGMAPHAHFIAFGLLLLSGMNMPVSEDLVFLISGSMAATVIPDNRIIIFLCCLSGAFLSDSISYSIGLVGGRKLLEVSLIRRIFKPEKIMKVENYFKKYGGKTLFFGRFIPFGMRNVLFMTSGFVHMHYARFFFTDLLAVSITSSILFTLGYKLGENYSSVLPYLGRYKIIIFSLFIFIIMSAILIHEFNKRKNASVV